MASASIRPAAVAGQFYPADVRHLQLQINEMLSAAVPPDMPAAPPKALVVPHAGYIYSGPVAATAYALLAHWRERFSKVVMLGPAHRVAVLGAALPAALSFQTPLGNVPVDRDDWQRLQAMPGIQVSEAAHAFEHCLEVQLPFLQSVLDQFTILPLLVGRMRAEDLQPLMEALWGGPETLILISSDLSHYHPYDEARVLDRGTCDRILALRPGIDHEHACGATPVNGLLAVAANHRLRPHLLDLRNSGDTAGSRDRVVGYASFQFDEDDDGARH
ncbi:MAG: AmmeMemoRadiSam system protein B [Rhodocyclaceae bacterium]|nr:AmmeMemoRadiSam system protein B [Rhodocyclaceae bacterium]